MEMGNTIDGITIAGKIIKDMKGEDSDKLASNFTNFSTSFKKRKCHCCMEYILDAGKAVCCANLISSIPCYNIYCQGCVVNFLKEKHLYDESEIEPSKPPSPKAVEDHPMEGAEKPPTEVTEETPE